MHRDYRLSYMHLSTVCFMKISLHSSGQSCKMKGVHSGGKMSIGQKGRA